MVKNYSVRWFNPESASFPEAQEIPVNDDTDVMKLQSPTDDQIWLALIEAE